MALTFGDENKANPMPSKPRIRTICISDVELPRKTKKSRPRQVRPIPAEATMRGSILSDKRPVQGESTACNTGCDTMIKPACSGDKALIYCRYRLSRKVME